MDVWMTKPTNKRHMVSKKETTCAQEIKSSHIERNNKQTPIEAQSRKIVDFWKKKKKKQECFGEGFHTGD